MRKAIAALGCILALAGCTNIKSGTITQRVYHAPYTDTWTSKYPAMHPESFELCMRNGNGDSGCIEVPHDEYNRYKVGDKYP